MDLSTFFKDKSVKPSEKTPLLATALQRGDLSQTALLAYAATAKDAVLGTCIEALEHVTKTDLQWLSVAALDFVIGSLGNKAPRVRWE